MAKSSKSSSDAATRKVWEEKLFREQQKESYFTKFFGKGMESLIQEKTDLTKEQGDEITYTLIKRLTGVGVTSNQQLEGNEEKLQDYTFKLALEEYAHAVRDAGPLDRQRPVYKMDDEHRSALKVWGSEKQDQLCFDALNAAPQRVMYKTSTGATNTTTAATAKTALTVADSKLTLDWIVAMRAYAETGGLNRAINPIRPVKVDGENYWVLLVHPWAAYDLRVSSAWQDAMKYAEIRGPTNPLFKNAVAIWNNVVVHTHENVPFATDAGAGANVPWVSGYFMGAQALCVGWGARPKVIEEEFDYQREHGFSWQMIFKAKKATFNNQDYGMLNVYMAATNLS